jgi:hypothetical protein
MPVTYDIYPAKKLIRTRCTGDLNPEEITAHFRELERDPNRPDRLNVLLDLSEVTSLPEAPDLRVVSHQIKELIPCVRFQACAIVACNEALFGTMRMFEVFAREYFVATHVFRVLGEAEAWLESLGLTSVA